MSQSSSNDDEVPSSIPDNETFQEKTIKRIQAIPIEWIFWFLGFCLFLYSVYTVWFYPESTKTYIAQPSSGVKITFDDVKTRAARNERLFDLFAHKAAMRFHTGAIGDNDDN